MRIKHRTVEIIREALNDNMMLLFKENGVIIGVSLAQDDSIIAVINDWIWDGQLYRN